MLSKNDIFPCQNVNRILRCEGSYDLSANKESKEQKGRSKQGSFNALKIQAKIRDFEGETHLAPSMPKNKRRFCYNSALHWNNLPNDAKIPESVSSSTSILKPKIS